jgi:uncharacterized protein
VVDHAGHPGDPVADVIRVVVLADTHLRAGSPRRLPAEVVDALGHADVVLHAGDLLDTSAFDALASHAPDVPLHVVRGNHDRSLAALPDRLVVDVGGVRIAMVHEPGARAGRARRLRRWFPDADVVVFGHTHAPLDEVGEDGQRLFNPGSPTERRRQPYRSYGVIEVDGGRIARTVIVALGP